MDTSPTHSLTSPSPNPLGTIAESGRSIFVKAHDDRVSGLQEAIADHPTFGEDGRACLQERGLTVSFAKMGRKLTLAGGSALALALLVFGATACTSDSDSLTTPGGPTSTGSESAQAQESTTTTVGGPVTTLNAPEVQGSLLHTVTVSGNGHMIALPDQAVINIGVQESAPTATEAFDANSKKMQDILARLKAEGIPDSAVETTNVSVYGHPLYDPKSGEVTGTNFQASNSVKVTLSDFSAIGSVFAAATEAGANNLSGPIWQLSDNTQAQTQALAKATEQAHAKAEAFAAANGVALGEVLVLNEGYSSPVYYYEGYGATATTTAAPASIAAPPISPQNLDISVNVTITYQLRR